MPPAKLPDSCVDNSVSLKKNTSIYEFKQARELILWGLHCRNGRKLRDSLRIVCGGIFDLPVVVEQVLKVRIIPYGRIQRPLPFKTTVKCVFATTEGA